MSSPRSSGPGDAIFYEADVIHTARGASDGPTIVLGTFVLEAGIRC